MSPSPLRFALSIALAAALLCPLAACSTKNPQGERARNTQMSEDPPAPPPESSSMAPAPGSQTETLENPAMIEDPAGAPSDAKLCNADKAQSAIGKTATQDVVDKIVADSGARSARVIKPGMAVTMDFREDRVNVDVDAANAIKSIRCG